MERIVHLKENGAHISSGIRSLYFPTSSDSQWDQEYFELHAKSDFEVSNTRTVFCSRYTQYARAV
jgi:hypothetical protein